MTMTKLYYGPYQRYDKWVVIEGYTNKAYGRKSLRGGIFLVYNVPDGWWRTGGIIPMNFETKVEAMANLDKELLNQGAVFLTEEQFNRLELLE
jgi:hypothetical protein